MGASVLWGSLRGVSGSLWRISEGLKGFYGSQARLRSISGSVRLNQKGSWMYEGVLMASQGASRDYREGNLRSQEHFGEVTGGLRGDSGDL